MRAGAGLLKCVQLVTLVSFAPPQGCLAFAHRVGAGLVKQGPLVTKQMFPKMFPTSYRDLRSNGMAPSSSRGACSAAQVPMQLTVRCPMIDSVFLILFGKEGGESRTMAFLNDVLYPDKKDDRIEELQLLDQTDEEKERNNERAMFFVILVEAHCRTVSGKQFIIEIQRPSCKTVWITYVSRELLHLSKHIPSQHGQSIQSAASSDKLLPVKVVTILEFDPKEEFLKNPADVIIEWDVREKVTSQVGTNVVSWSCICLARFNPQDNSSVGEKSRAWLSLLKQNDHARVELTNELVANDPTIKGAYQRIAYEARPAERSKDSDLQGLVECKDAFLFGKAEAEAKAKAKAKVDVEIAQAMLKSDFCVEQVAHLTGLSEPDVHVLKEQLEQQQ